MHIRTAVADLVVSAQRGDRAALGELIEAHLAMLYNVVGRALNGHADVDDVVQDILVRAMENLSSVREPARFSGWLLAIAQRQIADRIQQRRNARARTGWLDAANEPADPAADFAEATILRLGLSGQRRQVVEAVRWLDSDDRFLLSLWWLEVAGSITRADLAQAVGATPAHVAVRLKRMRDQLEVSRGIVRALDTRARCAGLVDVLDGWDGSPSPVWRKRLARHVRTCAECSTRLERLVPPDRLLAGLALVPVPPSVVVASTHAAAGGAAAGAAAQAGVVAAGGVGAAAASSGIGAVTLAKVVAGAVVAVVASAGLAVALHGGVSESGRRPSAIGITKAAVPAMSASAAAPASATASDAAPYGSVVDSVDAAPPRDRAPDPLPARPVGNLAVAASGDNDPRPDVVSLIHRGEWATYRGRGYLRVEFDVAYTQRVGSIAMPSWTGLRGKLFHVASGGGRRLDDPTPGAVKGTTGMGDPTHGYAGLPDGAQQMWSDEYYYLDGEVTFTSNERGADYNLYVHVVTRADINRDILTPPGRAGTPTRYGLDRDDGTDACPVPQYATRGRPQDPATAPQHSQVL